MMSRVFGMFTTVFKQCASWTNQLLNAVDGKDVVISIFTLILVINLLFIPLRGRSLLTITDGIKGYGKTKIYKARLKHDDRKKG